jgi:hypothetical protein
MTMHKNSRILGLLASTALTFCSLAGPTGSHSFSFSGPNQTVWDISGPYTLSPTVGDEVEVTFPILITQDSQGKLTGGGDVSVIIDGENVPGTYSLKGTIARSGGVAKVNATVKLSGQGNLKGILSKYNLNATYKLDIDPASRTIIGTARGSAKATGIGSGPINDNFTQSLPANMNGGWQLNVNLSSPSATKLSGTSSIHLNNGRNLDLGLKGSYTSKTHKSSIALTGANTAKGTTLTVTGTDDALTTVTVKGKILGQNVQ